MIDSARPRARMLPVAIAALALLALPLSGCDVLNVFQDDVATTEETEELSGVIGPCLAWFDRGVIDLAMSADGMRTAYVASRRPESLSEDAWRSGDRAVFIRDINAQGAPATRYIATTWSPLDEIPSYATEDPNASGRGDAIPLPEQIEEVALSDDGTRIVIGVSREAIDGGLAKLYVGSVPDDTTSTLKPPDGGLSIIPINTYTSGETVGRFELSPDGTKVATALGPRGELRVYDLAANVPIVYSLGEENAVEVSNDLPPVSTSLRVDRRAAILTGGSTLHWSPDGTRIAFARTIPVSTSHIQIIDVASGELLTVDTIVGFTTPQLAWASDGASLFAMSTHLADSEAFGRTEVRRIEAEEDGRVIGSPVSIARKAHWRTEPNQLVPLGNDQQFIVSLDNQLMRLDLPTGDSGAPEILELAGYQQGTRIPAQRVFTSAAADRAVFLLSTGSAMHVGQRTYVGQDVCPEAPTRAAPEDAEGGAEPTAEG